VKLDVVDAVIENLQEFCVIAGTLVRFLSNLGPGLEEERKKQIGKAILTPILDEKNPPSPYYGMWVLNMVG
jgi:hypothetical protein